MRITLDVTLHQLNGMTATLRVRVLCSPFQDIHHYALDRTLRVRVLLLSVS